MRRSLVLVVALASALVTVPTADGGEPRAYVDPLVYRRAGVQNVLVHVRPGVPLSVGIDAATEAGLGLAATYPEINVFSAFGTLEALSALAEADAIEGLEANRPLTYFTDSSHEATRGELLLADRKLIGRRIDGSGVGVAVIDSGVDGTHPDLGSRIRGNVRVVCTVPGGLFAFNFEGVGLGFSECRGPREYVAMTDSDVAGGHGTHVSGIVAGTGQASGFRFHGAAPGAALYVVAAGTSLTVENSLDGLRWVLENHDRVNPPIRVVNNSWGGGPGPGSESDPLQGAITKMQNALIAEGVTVVFAAGNTGGTGSNQQTTAQCALTTPGNICVASYDDKNDGRRNGDLSSFSSRGHRTRPETWPDLSAPGHFIISTCRYTLPVCWIHAGQQLNPPNLYSSLAGTSMAAPHVSGIVAQMYQVNPNLTPARVEDILEDTAHKFTFGAPYQADPFNRDDTSSYDKGHGLVDAYAAVLAAQQFARKTAA